MQTKLFSLLLLLLQIVSAQEPSANEVRQVESLLDSAYAKVTIVDMKSSALFALQAEQLSRKINYTSGEAWSKFYVGQALFELWAYKQSLQYLQSAEILNEKIQDHFLSFEICRVRSRLYSSMYLLDAAIREQKKGLALIPTIERPLRDKKYLASLAYENLVVTFNNLSQKDSSFFYLQKNKALIENQESSFFSYNQITLYSMLGAYYTDVGNFSEAELYLKKSEQIAEKYDYPYISFTYINYGDLELKKNNPKSAIIYYDKSLKILNETNFKHEIPEVYNKIAVAYEHLGKQDSTKEYRFKSLEYQNELRSEQLSASSSAIEEILKSQSVKADKRSLNQSKIFWMITSISFLLLLLLFFKYYKSQKIKRIKEQIINEKELENKELKIVELNNKIKDSLDEIVELAKTNNPVFFTRFREVYPEVVAKLLEINPNLKVSELTLCAYIYLGFPTKEIANYTFTAVSTVKKRKYNLRKKLEISADENTEMWFNNLV